MKCLEVTLIIQRQDLELDRLVKTQRNTFAIPLTRPFIASGQTHDVLLPPHCPPDQTLIRGQIDQIPMTGQRHRQTLKKGRCKLARDRERCLDRPGLPGLQRDVVLIISAAQCMVVGQTTHVDGVQKKGLEGVLVESY